MNPLTLVKRTQKITAKEAELGISEEASWHATYKDSAYVFAGGLPYDLTEGDLLAVFAQYGEIVDVNLVREKSTGKSKGFAFIAYEDQRSTTLAVDNLNGAQLAGRTLRVDHVANYKKKEEEDEETEKQKREERGVCRAFQRGECKYGDSCRFSHDAQRAADTGWGRDEERKSKSAHDKFVNRSSDNKSSRDALPSCIPEQKQPSANDGRSFSGKKTTEFGRKRNEISSGDRDQGFGDRAKRLEHREDRDKGMAERKSSRYEPESNKSGDRDEREEINTRRNIHDERDRDRGRDRDRDRDRVRDISKDRRATDWDKDRDADRTKQSVRTRDNSSQRHGDQDRDAHRLSRRDEDYHRPRR